MNNKELLIAPEELSTVFQKYLSNENYNFVFSTDVVMNSWIDWCVMNPELSGTSAVPLERFKAWDSFKSEFVSGTEEGKSSIPSILRKLFIRNLINQNAVSPFFKKIINPEYAGKAVSFTDWLAGLLPSLKLWHSLRIEKYLNDKADPETGSNQMPPLDEEEQDYLELYNRYTEFLKQNKMFEPSWIIPDFSGTGKKFIIIYPELLEDYADYKTIFDQTEDITLVKLPPVDMETKGPECLQFSDSRKELRRTLLKIRELVETKQTTYPEITLSVPSLEIYRPYLEREFTKYCIPYVIRAGHNLTTNCAGHIFQEINDCYSADFSYDSLRTLLLDEYIPWKKDIAVLRENLIRTGQNLRCLCSYEDLEKNQKIDVWNEALNSSSQTNMRELILYKSLKKDVKTLCEASSFKNLHKAWEIFKENFLEEQDFTEESDNILSRCVTSLNELSEIEETYLQPMNLAIDNCYDFFLNEISGETYTPQSKNCGVNIYPYRLSAAANFSYQFVIDASQKNLEIPYKRLAFLSTEKRISLGLDKEDKYFNVSKAFIRLYSKSNCQFSYAENTFNGFAIAHNFLTLSEEKNPLAELDEKDFILAEENLFLHNKVPQKPVFTQEQKNQAEQWFQKNNTETLSESTKEKIQEKIQNQIEYVLKTYRNKSKLSITQSDMRNFFPCPKHWLYNSVIKLGEDSLDSELMSGFDIGNINHSVMELFLNWCIENNNKKLPETNFEGVFETEPETQLLIEQFTEQIIKKDFAASPLAYVTLLSQKDKLTRNIMDFLHAFCKPQSEKGFGNCTVLGTEKWFEANPEGKDWCYSGKMDCILSDDNEEIYIIDFKTFNAPSAASCIATEDDRLSDFQIPLYITLWDENQENAKADNALFYSIPNMAATVVVQPSEKKKGRAVSVDRENYENTLRVFDNYAAAFYSRASTANMKPDTETKTSLTYVEPHTTCSGCSYKAICRTVYSIKKGEI